MSFVLLAQLKCAIYQWGSETLPVPANLKEPPPTGGNIGFAKNWYIRVGQREIRRKLNLGQWFYDFFVLCLVCFIMSDTVEEVSHPTPGPCIELTSQFSAVGEDPPKHKRTPMEQQKGNTAKSAGWMRTESKTKS